jgi:hypothetical protein
VTLKKMRGSDQRRSDWRSDLPTPNSNFSVAVRVLVRGMR